MKLFTANVKAWLHTSQVSKHFAGYNCVYVSQHSGVHCGDLDDLSSPSSQEVKVNELVL